MGWGGPLGVILVNVGLLAAPPGVAEPDPEPERTGLYTDREAETFKKRLEAPGWERKSDLRETLTALGIQPKRLRLISHQVGSETQWYSYRISPNYTLWGGGPVGGVCPWGFPPGMPVNNLAIRPGREK